MKLFHALYSRIPILVSPDTFVGGEAKKLLMESGDDYDILFEVRSSRIHEVNRPVIRNGRIMPKA